MEQRRLFEPPPKPRPALSDEHIALKVARWLQRWALDRGCWEYDTVESAEVNELAEGMMATNTDDWKTVHDWICEHRPRSNWRWEDLGDLLEWKFKDACEAVLPNHKRRQRFA